MRDIIEVGHLCQERFLDQHAFPELAQYDIWLGGLSELHGHHRVERVFQQRCMLTYTLEGSGWFTWQGKTRPLHAGEAVFICTAPLCSTTTWRP